MTDALTCKELVEIVTEYLEGTLSLDERARFEAHLAPCRGCTAYLDQMRKTVTLVGHLSEEAIPEESKRELLQLFSNWKKNRQM